MTKFVLIEKTSDCKEVEVKNLKIEDLYKKCGYRKVTDDFKLLTKWNVKVNGKQLYLCLYGKVNGKSGTENKTELPPPVDKELYFGTLALVNYNEKLNDVTIEEWEKAYEKLYECNSTAFNAFCSSSCICIQYSVGIKAKTHVQVPFFFNNTKLLS